MYGGHGVSSFFLFVKYCRLRVLENGECVTTEGRVLYQLNEEIINKMKIFPNQIVKFAVLDFDLETSQCNLRIQKPHTHLALFRHTW
mgnify:CR=1 FL=1